MSYSISRILHIATGTQVVSSYPFLASLSRPPSMPPICQVTHPSALASNARARDATPARDHRYRLVLCACVNGPCVRARYQVKVGTFLTCNADRHRCLTQPVPNAAHFLQRLCDEDDGPNAAMHIHAALHASCCCSTHRGTVCRRCTISL